jgi:murein DD-endopeptidase MepM/ murein hydrolase activator NlpD
MKPKIDISNPWLWAGLGGVAIAGAALFYTKQQTTMNAALPFEPILNPMIIRDDAGGSGWFESNRIGHVHQGTDFVCRPGQSIYSPFSGTIVRESKPYANDLRWNGLLLRSDDGSYECKLFYCTLAEDVGKHVERNKLIAFAQGISAKYSSGVTDHIHVEVRRNGVVVNPENLWSWTVA